MSLVSKVCIICGELTPIADFYKHKQMADGRLNKCKTCCKAQAKAREELLRKDPEWVESEKSRAREKYRRLDYKTKQLEWDKKRPWTKTATFKGLHKKYVSEYGLDNSINLHHWDYNKLKEVFVLDSALHRKIHTDLELEGLVFKVKSAGTPLNTLSKHYDYIMSHVVNPTALMVISQ